MKLKRFLFPGLAALLAIMSVTSCAMPYHDGPVSDHFDGTRFYNYEPAEKSFTKFLKWKWQSDAAEWPEWVESEYGPPPPQRVDGENLRVTFINHATLLIQTQGINLLTDPIWSRRASPVSWFGPERVRAPGIRFEDLPPIDFVLISHDHYDSLNLPTLKALQRLHNPIFLAGLGTKELLKDAMPACQCETLDWWQSITATGRVVITFVPARHWARRSLFDTNKRLWGGFVIETPDGNIYFSGDTGMGSHFEKIQDTFGSFRLALLPTGGYEPRWFMRAVHVNPDEAVRVMKSMGIAYAVGNHYETFQLTDEGYKQPARDLDAALASHHVSPQHFRMLKFGEGWNIPEVSPSQ